MAITTTGNISIKEAAGAANSIDTEVSSVSSGSLVTLSQNSINYTGSTRGSSPRETDASPYGMLEFSGYAHILTSGNLTNYYSWPPPYYGPAYSGYSAAGSGSWTGSNFQYDGDEVQLYGLANFDPAGPTAPSLFLTFRRTDNSTGTFNTVGWTNLNIYLNQTDNNGNPDLTLARTSASWTPTPPMVGWSWGPSSSYAISSYFGTTSNNTHHIEIL